MKTVFSKTQDVCDVWAKGEQEDARTGSNTRFRRDTLRSYGTAIARIVQGKGGERIALISSKSWSSSTSKVQSEASFAAQLLFIPVFRVPHLGADESDVARNLAWFADKIEEILRKMEAVKHRGEVA